MIGQINSALHLQPRQGTAALQGHQYVFGALHGLQRHPVSRLKSSPSRPIVVDQGSMLTIDGHLLPFDPSAAFSRWSQASDDAKHLWLF